MQALAAIYAAIIGYDNYLGGPGSQLENYALAGLATVVNTVFAALGQVQSSFPSVPGL